MTQSPAAVEATAPARKIRRADPRQLLLLDALPLRGPGKPDRARLRELAARRDG